MMAELDGDETQTENEPYQVLEVRLENFVSYAHVVIVDNLPIVPPEKFQKLYNVIHKIVSNVGPIRESGLTLPTDPATKLTLGFAFVEFVDPKSAHQAVEKLNGGKLDKSHIFAVNLYEDLARYAQIPDEYIAPQPKDYEEKENLRWWLMDPKHQAGDQFVTRVGDDTEIYWYESNKKPELLHKKKSWTESYLTWSPLGSYLVTFHVQGIILWGGDSWKKLFKLQHPGVKLIDFSPKENFLVTFSPQQPDSDSFKDSQLIIIWDVRSGKKLRSFPAGESNVWPVFKWSFDDKYFARLGKGQISVFETPSMNMLDKKSLKIPNVKDFCWSPTQHVISCWVPESDSHPASVILLDLPSKKEKTQKNLFNVNDCNMHWSNRGDYLCVKVDRKTKKSTSTNFELFRMREKNIPIEVLEMKHNITAFAWEPNGHRFAVIHSADPNVNRFDVSFYTMEGSQVKLLKTLEKKQANHLFWSPAGDFIVLAGLKNLNGVFEFFDVNEMETMNTSEHLMANEVEWDPTGRFVATISSAWRHQLENGYCMWSFQGKCVHKLVKDKFLQFSWRPRPPSLLSEEKEKEIRKNLSKYSKKYSEIDKENREKARRERQRARDALRKKFEDYMALKAEEFSEERKLRREILGLPPLDPNDADLTSVDDEFDEYDYVIKDVEEVTQYEEIID